MALSWEQYPVVEADKVPVLTNWTPLIGWMLYRNASIASLFYYKLIVEVRLDDASGTLIAKMKQRRNGYSVDVAANLARAFFDLRDIANSVLVDTVFDQNDTGQPFRAIHKVGKNTGAKPYSVNGDNTNDKTQIQLLHVKGFEEYSSSASASPQEQTGDAITDVEFFTAASLPLMTTRDSDPDYIQSNAFNVFGLTSDANRFMSDLEASATGTIVGSATTTNPGEVYRNYVQSLGDYHTVGFLNGATDFNSECYKIQVTYYDGSNQLTQNEFDQTSTYGGQAPNLVTTDPQRILYFGCGTGNLTFQSVHVTSRPNNANNAGWTHYTIQALDNSDAAASALYYFINQDGSCKGFKIRRLAFRNSLGCYDYFNFKMKSTSTIEVSRDNYNSMLGTFNKSRWRYNNTQRGKTTRQTTAILKETIQTDWISEQDANLLEKLAYSTDVYILENLDTDFTEGVVVTDSSFVKKTVANDNMIQYTINIEYANPINTNS
jgi:hypothetical protein